MSNIDIYKEYIQDSIINHLERLMGNDLSLTHLAKHIGTNNTYLSRYFAYKGITYSTHQNRPRCVKISPRFM